MKHIILFFLLLSSLFAFDPSIMNVYQNNKKEIQNVIKPVDFPTEKEIIKKYNEALEFGKKKKEEVDPLKESLIQYFGSDEIAFSECSMRCPDLLPEFSESMSIRLNSYSLEKGVIECTVNNKITPDKTVFRFTFLNKKCKEIEAAAKEQLQEKHKLSVQKLDRRNYLTDIKNEFFIDQKNGKKYLDFADIMDAVSAIDPDIINLNETVASNVLTLNNNKYISDLEEFEVESTFHKGDILNQARAFAKKYINHNFNFFDEPDLSKATEININSVESNMAFFESGEWGSFVSMFVWINEELRTLLIWLGFALVSLNLTHMLGDSFSTGEFFSKNEEKQNQRKWKYITMIAATFIFFVVFVKGGDAIISEKYEHYNNKIQYEKTMFQSTLSYLYQEINSLSDMLVTKVYDRLNERILSRNGIISQKMDILINENIDKLQRQNETLRASYDQCLKIYDTDKFSSHAFNEDRSDYLVFTPFFKSEKIASSKTWHTNHPYKGEFFKNIQSYKKEQYSSSDWIKKVVPSNYPLISTCFSFKKQEISNQRIIKKYNIVRNLGEKDKFESQNIKLLSSLIRENYELVREFGYFSIIFYPIQQYKAKSLIDDKREELLMNNGKKIDDDFVKDAAESLPYIIFFNIQKIADHFMNMIPGGKEMSKTVKLGKYFPLVTAATSIGGSAMDATIVSYLKDLFEGVTYFIILIIGGLVLLLTFLEKALLVVFSPFIVVFLMSGYQFKNVLSKIQDYGYLIVYTILIVFAISLSTYILIMSNQLVSYVLDTVMSFEFIRVFDKITFYGIYGFVKFIFNIFITFYIIYLILKLPEKIWNYFGKKEGSTLSDDVGDKYTSIERSSQR